jgi:alanyl-tRNA synthetase
VNNIAAQLAEQYKQYEDFRLITARVNLDPNAVRDLTFKLMHGHDDLVVIIGSHFEDKPLLTVSVAEPLVKSKGFNASTMIKELAKEIKGGGGGQPHYATAGGKDIKGLDNALAKAGSMV